MRRRLAALAAGALLSCARPAAADPPPLPMRSPALVAGGTVLAVAGAAGVAFGVIRVSVSELCPGTCSNPGKNELIGGAVLGAGAAALAGGVVMIVLGSRPAPAVSAWVGAPGGAGWRWRF